MELNITTEDETSAPRIVLYGVHGIGKTTFGTAFPKPVFLRTEDGMKGKQFAGVARMPLCRNWSDVIDQLKSVLTQEHEFKSLVLDSVDWLELLIQAQVAEDKGESDIADIGYQAGYKLAASKLMVVLNMLSEINRRRNMLICLLGHSEVKRFDTPDSEPYDRYGLALHKNSAPLVYEWADAVLFVNYETFTKKVGESFGKDKFQAIGEGQRVMYSEERPAYHAKNRFGLPSQMPFVWNALAEGIFGKPTKKEKKENE